MELIHQPRRDPVNGSRHPLYTRMFYALDDCATKWEAVDVVGKGLSELVENSWMDVATALNVAELHQRRNEVVNSDEVRKTQILLGLVRGLRSLADGDRYDEEVRVAQNQFAHLLAIDEVSDRQEVA